MPEVAEQKSIVNVDKVDVGINSTMPSDRVTWATGRNVRFTPGYVSKTLGKTALATLAIASLPVRASFTFMDYAGNMYTVVCCDAYVYAANGDFTAFSDITPTSAPTGGASDIWEFTIVAGLPILTNGKDAVWSWADPDAKLSVMTGVPLAKHLGCSMHRLVCSNVYENGQWYPGRIKWSEMGNPFNFVIDTTKKAGRFDIVNYAGGPDTQHNIVCQVLDGPKAYFFTERNLWTSDFSQSTKQFVILDHKVEIISPRAACVRDGVLYAAAKDDFWKYPKQSIGLPIRTEYLAGIASAYMGQAFCFDMITASEIWFCVTTAANTSPDTAYVWNWELQNWTICDCDFSCHAVAYPPATYAAWINNSSATVTWVNTTPATIKWLMARYNAKAKDIVGDSASHLLNADTGFNAISTALAAVAINGLIESGDMPLGARPFEKIMEELYPDILKQTQTNSLMIQIGVRDTMQHSISWGQAVAFRIGTDYLADVRSYAAQGAYVRIRFYTNVVDSPWSMGSYSFFYRNGRRIR